MKEGKAKSHRRTTAANRHVNCKALIHSALQSPQRLCRKTLSEIADAQKLPMTNAMFLNQVNLIYYEVQ